MKAFLKSTNKYQFSDILVCFIFCNIANGLVQPLVQWLSQAMLSGDFVQFKLYTGDCILYILSYSLQDTVQCMIYSTVYSVQYKFNTLYCTVRCKLYTVHWWVVTNGGVVPLSATALCQHFQISWIDYKYMYLPVLGPFLAL